MLLGVMGPRRNKIINKLAPLAACPLWYYWIQCAGGGFYGSFGMGGVVVDEIGNESGLAPFFRSLGCWLEN
jgi:hypothetical protein